MLQEFLEIWEKNWKEGLIHFDKEPIKATIGHYREENIPIVMLYAPWRSNRPNANAAKS